jgi:hypothetical protein
MAQKPEVTARANIERALAHLGLLSCVVITAEADDRVYGIPVDGSLRRYVREAGWRKDPGDPSGLHDGALESWREPGAVIPALQVCFLKDGRVEIDLDIAAPLGGDVVSFVVHAAEIAWHWLTRSKTDQKRMAKLLDKRFGVLA